MPALIYSAIASLDGYVADKDGGWGWSRPDEEVHTFINDLERQLPIHLYGRRMYEVLRAWEDLDLTDQPSCMADFKEIWRGADKIVFSRTLSGVSTARTRLERHFDTDMVRQLKATANDDILVGGPELAAQAIDAGLVDEIHLFLAPVVVGGGKKALPDDLRLDLELLDERRFGNGTVHLHYRTTT
ncbi:MAG TPA: dihydrofolate reductase family protein [Gaiellaceae bacterium]|nr:dihydrofolate reductase family protein [Gaiellaceae bacterium]